jgi:hypothetical protein
MHVVMSVICSVPDGTPRNIACVVFPAADMDSAGRPSGGASEPDLWDMLFTPLETREICETGHCPVSSSMAGGMQ